MALGRCATRDARNGLNSDELVRVGGTFEAWLYEDEGTTRTAFKGEYGPYRQGRDDAHELAALVPRAGYSKYRSDLP